LSPGFTNFETVTPALLDIQTGSDGLTATASLSASFRLPPNLDIETARSRIAEAAGLETVQFGPADAAFQSPKTTKLVGSLVRSIREEQTQPRFKHKTGTSDMNVVGPVWGCPAVAYGPGDSSLDHTPNEHIAIDEYLRGIRVLTRVFQEWNPC
jgi:LysW-gamma-L-lysine carboxypeptidase